MTTVIWDTYVARLVWLIDSEGYVCDEHVEPKVDWVQRQYMVGQNRYAWSWLNGFTDQDWDTFGSLLEIECCLNDILNAAQADGPIWAELTLVFCEDGEIDYLEPPAWFELDSNKKFRLRTYDDLKRIDEDTYMIERSE